MMVPDLEPQFEQSEVGALLFFGEQIWDGLAECAIMEVLARETLRTRGYVLILSGSYAVSEFSISWQDHVI